MGRESDGHSAPKGAVVFVMLSAVNLARKDNYLLVFTLTNKMFLAAFVQNSNNIGLNNYSIAAAKIIHRFMVKTINCD